jgi:hypothetical protein
LYLSVKPAIVIVPPLRVTAPEPIAVVTVRLSARVTLAETVNVPVLALVMEAVPTTLASPSALNVSGPPVPLETVMFRVELWASVPMLNAPSSVIVVERRGSAGRVRNRRRVPVVRVVPGAGGGVVPRLGQRRRARNGDQQCYGCEFRLQHPLSPSDG